MSNRIFVLLAVFVLIVAPGCAGAPVAHELLTGALGLATPHGVASVKATSEDNQRRIDEITREVPRSEWLGENWQGLLLAAGGALGSIFGVAKHQARREVRRNGHHNGNGNSARDGARPSRKRAT